MAPELTQGLEDYLAPIRTITGTFAQAEALLAVYMAKRNDIARKHFPELKAAVDTCDGNTALFRNMLLRLGIQSRIIVFEFTDGSGKKSHAALEVWDSENKRWFYADAHFGNLDVRTVIDIAEQDRKPSTIGPRIDTIKELFEVGTQQFMIETKSPRSRIVLQRQN